jgi:hypothetical protein
LKGWLTKKILKKCEACCLRPVLVQYFLNILLQSQKFLRKKYHGETTIGKLGSCGSRMFFPDPVPDPGSRVKKIPDPRSGST